MRDLRGVVRALAAMSALAFLAAPALGHEVDEAEAAPAPAEPEPEPEPAKWEGRIALGGSLRGGDENRYSGNADSTLKRFFPQDTWTFRAQGDYGKTGGDRDTENFGAELSWRHDWSGRFFWRTSTAANHDAVQGRNLRFTVDSGPGYRIWEAAEKRFLDFSAGVGYRHERFRNDSNNDLADLRSGYEYQDVIGEVLELVHKSDLFAPATDIENFLAKSELTLSVPLIGGLHFRNNARYEYVNEPAEDKKESNFWLTIGLEYRL